jgi:hypothetical protein
LGRIPLLASSARWDRRLRSLSPASSLPCLCALLEDSVHPDFRRHVIDAQVAGSQATKELVRMLGTAQSGQSLLFCLRYDFPTEWSAFVNGSDDFQATLGRQYFPYATQSAPKLTIDAVTLYAAGPADGITPSTPLSGSNLPIVLNGPDGSATLSLPVDPVMRRDDPALQVFMVPQYQFG